MTKQIIERHFDYLYAVGTIFFFINFAWGSLLEIAINWISLKSATLLKFVHILTNYILTLILLMMSVSLFPTQLRNWPLICAHFILGTILIVFWLVLTYKIEARISENLSTKSSSFYLIITGIFLLIYLFFLYFSSIVEMSQINPIMWPGFVLYLLLRGLHDFKLDQMLAVLGFASSIFLGYRCRDVITNRFKRKTSTTPQV